MDENRDDIWNETEDEQFELEELTEFPIINQPWPSADSDAQTSRSPHA